MANLAQLDILWQGVKAWNIWRAKNHHEVIDLSSVNLSGLQMHRANLSNADFSNTRLEAADLRGSFLDGAVFRDADLSWAMLREADLRGAKLNGAILYGTDLDEVTLRGADLRDVLLKEANLSSTGLIECDLQGAKFQEARCFRTHFSNLDLSVAVGLDEIFHYGVSYVDIHSLVKSSGKIPEIFLRGCGLSDEFISYIPSLFGKAIDFYSCFISYSHSDKKFAETLYKTLQKHNISCWLDEHEINAGDDIHTEIDRGIRQYDKVILCASRNSLASWWVDSELNRLFEKERQLMKDRGNKVVALIPVDLDGYLFSSEYQGGKKDEIMSRKIENFQGWEQDNTIFEREIERVIRALRTDGGKTTPPPPKL